MLNGQTEDSSHFTEGQEPETEFRFPACMYEKHGKEMVRALSPKGFASKSNGDSWWTYTHPTNPGVFPAFVHRTRCAHDIVWPLRERYICGGSGWRP